MFPDELPGLTLVREVEFTNELQPGTAPIFMTPYHFAPVKLVELKKQLQKLLGFGYIRPSVSS